MDRERLSELLSAYVDGELTPRETELVEQLVREDDGARRTLDELRASVGVLASLPRHAAPPSILEDVAARLERVALFGEVDQPATIRPASRLPWLGITAAAATIGLVVATGMWIVPSDRSPPGADATMLARKPNLDDATSMANRELRPEGVRDENLRSSPPVAGAKMNVGPDLETKLARGASRAEIEGHAFDVETVRVRLAAANVAQQEYAATAIESRLRSGGLANFKEARVDADGAAQAGGFYVAGDPAVNFSNAAQKQLLIRVPAHEADRVIEAVSRAEIPSDKVELQAGALRIQGLNKTRDTFKNLAGTPPEGGVRTAGGHVPAHASDSAADGAHPAAARPPRSTDPIADLLRMMGLDPGTVPALAGSGDSVGRGTVLATADGNGPEAPENVGPVQVALAKSKTSRQPAAESASAEDSSTRVEEETASTASASRDSLVDRRLQELDDDDKKEAGSSLPPSDRHSRRAAREAAKRSVVPPSAQEPFVTLVIEIDVDAAQPTPDIPRGPKPAESTPAAQPAREPPRPKR